MPLSQTKAFFPSQIDIGKIWVNSNKFCHPQSKENLKRAPDSFGQVHFGHNHQQTPIESSFQRKF